MRIRRALQDEPADTKKAPRKALFSLSTFESGFLATDATTETLLETVDTATGIHHFLLACVERVTLGAHIQSQVLSERGTCLENITAGTGSGNLGILGVNTFFHGEPLSVMPLPDHGTAWFS